MSGEEGLTEWRADRLLVWGQFITLPLRVWILSARMSYFSKTTDS